MGRNWFFQHLGQSWGHGTAFSHIEGLAEATVPFLNPPCTESQSQQVGACWGSISLARTVCRTLVILWGSAPPNLWAQPNCIQWLFPMNGLSWPIFLIFSKLSQTSNIWLHQAPYLLSCPRPSSSGSWPFFTSWHFLVISKPSTSSSHLQNALYFMLCDPGQNTHSGWPWMWQ